MSSSVATASTPATIQVLQLRSMPICVMELPMGGETTSSYPLKA